VLACLSIVAVIVATVSAAEVLAMAIAIAVATIVYVVRQVRMKKRPDNDLRGAAV
jgi:hypothetical protein